MPAVKVSIFTIKKADGILCRRADGPADNDLAPRVDPYQNTDAIVNIYREYLQIRN